MLFGLQVLYTYDGQWQAEIWLHKYHDTLRRMISHGCLVCTSTVADSCSVKFQGSLLNSDSLWEACGLLPCLLCRIIMNHHVYSDCKPNVTTLRIYWRYIIICQFARTYQGNDIYIIKTTCAWCTRTHTHTSHRTSIAVLHKSVLFAACKDIVHTLGTHVHTVNHSWFHCKLRTSATEVEAVWDAIRPLPASGSLIHRPPIATVCYHVSIVSFHFSEF